MLSRRCRPMPPSCRACRPCSRALCCAPCCATKMLCGKRDGDAERSTQLLSTPGTPGSLRATRREGASPYRTSPRPPASSVSNQCPRRSHLPALPPSHRAFRCEDRGAGELCAASRRAARGCRARLGRHAPRRCHRHVPRLPPSPSPRLRPRRRLRCRRPLPQQSPLAPGPPSFLSLPPKLNLLLNFTGRSEELLVILISVNRDRLDIDSRSTRDRPEVDPRSTRDR